MAAHHVRGHQRRSATGTVSWVRDHEVQGSLALDLAEPTKPKAVFASGSNTVSEIHGFTQAGVAPGVAVHKLSEPAIQRLEALAGTGIPVFVDSGAFSEVEAAPPFRVTNPITDQEWRDRLAIYRRLALRLKGQLYCVAPDQIGSQTVTLERLARYKAQVQELHSLGANVLVACQKGAQSQAEFFATAKHLLGFEPVAALPAKKAATTPTELEAFLRAAKPRKVHLLGLGPNSRTLPAMVQAIESGHPEVEWTQDAAILVAAVERGEHRPLTMEEAAEIGGFDSASELAAFLAETGLKPGLAKLQDEIRQIIAKGTRPAKRKLTAAQDDYREDARAKRDDHFHEHLEGDLDWLPKAARQRIAQSTLGREDQAAFVRNPKAVEWNGATYRMVADYFYGNMDSLLSDQRRAEAVRQVYQDEPYAIFRPLAKAAGRARKGGQVGVNGERYEGGQFLPSTDQAKRHKPKAKASGKQEVAPYQWELPPSPEARSIFRLMGPGQFTGLDRTTGKYGLHPTINWAHFFPDPAELAAAKAKYQALADRYNAGERWVYAVDPSRPVRIVHIQGDEAGPKATWKEATGWAKENLRGTYSNEATGWDVTVASNGIQEGIHRLAAAGHPEAIAAIPGIIANAVPVHTGPDLKGRSDVHAVHILVAPLGVGGTVFRAVLTVCDTVHGHGYHGHQIERLDIEVPGDLGEVHRQGQLGVSHPPGTLSLGQLLQGFNRNITKATP